VKNDNEVLLHGVDKNYGRTSIGFGNYKEKN
jgi:hypothetical protein